MAPQFRDIVVAKMIQDGRDFGWCEVNNHKIDGRWCIHHTKYEGATYQDLQISCFKCNVLPENKFLD